MTNKVIIQSLAVPIGTVRGARDEYIPVYATNEWRRPLEQMAVLVNAQQATIEALTARIVALGG